MLSLNCRTLDCAWHKCDSMNYSSGGASQIYIQAGCEAQGHGTGHAELRGRPLGLRGRAVAAGALRRLLATCRAKRAAEERGPEADLIVCLLQVHLESLFGYEYDSDDTSNKHVAVSCLSSFFILIFLGEPCHMRFAREARADGSPRGPAQGRCGCGGGQGCAGEGVRVEKKLRTTGIRRFSMDFFRF